MEITYSYSKKRSQFGRKPDFIETEPKIIIDSKPKEKLVKKYIYQNPISKGIQSLPELSENSTNTETIETKETSMNHLEGGWPKDVDFSENDSKKRHIKKLEQDEKYPKAIKGLAETMEHFVKQNNTIDIFEEYFTEYKKSFIGDTPFAQIVTVFKDPDSIENKIKRTAVNLSWQTSQEAKKIAAAYCIRQFQKVPPSMSVRSHIWDITNPLEPSDHLDPISSPLWCVEFNPKESYILVGGTYDGVVKLFDIRKGSKPTISSSFLDSHKDPIYDIKWIQSKNSTMCVSCSTDGQFLIWDTKNLSEPVEKYSLDIPPSRTGGRFQGMVGCECMDYNASYSPTKFLLGTEQNIIVSVTRRKKKPLQIDRAYFGHHAPVNAVMRNPFCPVYFCSIGDWSIKFWHEEIATPIMTTHHHKTQLTDALWSPTKPSVFFTTKMNGNLDVWDVLEKFNKPTLSVNVSSGSLYSLISKKDGRQLAVGDSLGQVSLIELSDYLSGYEPSLQGVDKKKEVEEKEKLNFLFDKETKREKIVADNRKQIALEKKRDQQLMKDGGMNAIKQVEIGDDEAEKLYKDL